MVSSQLMFYSVHCMWPKKSHIMLNKTEIKKRRKLAICGVARRQKLWVVLGEHSPQGLAVNVLLGAHSQHPQHNGDENLPQSTKSGLELQKQGQTCRVRRKGRRHSRDCSVTHWGGKAVPWHTFPTARPSPGGQQPAPHGAEPARPERAQGRALQEMGTAHENNTPGAE